MRHPFLIAAMLPALAASGVAAAAGIDRARARSDPERLICSEVSLGARDAILSKLSSAALRQDADGRIGVAQRKWRLSAEACGTVACLKQAYDGRIGALMATAGGNGAATHFFNDEAPGRHGTLDVVGPTRGFAAVSLTSTSVGAAGADAGDVNVGSISAVLDLRHGPARVTDKGCTVTFRPVADDRWIVAQSGPCDLPQGTAFAGTYKR